MNDLIKQLEKAKEGSRELDKLIAKELGTTRWIKSDGEPDVGIFGDKELWWPPYTTNLQAALSLIPQKYDWLISKVDGDITVEIGKEGTFDFITETGRTLELNICIAWFKIRKNE